MMIEFSLALIVIACLLFWLRRDLRAGIARIERAEAHRQEFYTHAEKLVSNPAVPDDVASLLVYISSELRSKKVLRGFVWDLALKRRRTLNDRARRIAKEIDAMPDNLRASLYQSCIAAFVATTYNNRILGAAIRRFIIWAVDRNSGSRPVTEATVAQYARHQRHHPQAA